MVQYRGNACDYAEISEVMGSEIACCGKDGWIRKFSKLGKFAL
jgi:hypothetical protein